MSPSAAFTGILSMWSGCFFLHLSISRSMVKRLLVGTAVCANLVFGQCSVCRNAAAAQGTQSAVLDAAILVLLIPAVTLFGTIVLTTIKISRREK
jgi:hypothetical protein